MARLLLDLFCKAGGAAKGYADAGFKVVGVDIEPQPHYPYEFVQADALTFPLDGFDAIHASPPCQAFTVYGNNKAHMRNDHPDLIGPTRERLVAAGVPWVIENVPPTRAGLAYAPLRDPIQLCGTSFPPLEVRRHRLFECSFPLHDLVPPCDHGRLTERKYPGSSNRPNGRTVCNIGEYRVPVWKQKLAIQIDWMDLAELAQAVPPPYTEWVGRQLLIAIELEEEKPMKLSWPALMRQKKHPNWVEHPAGGQARRPPLGPYHEAGHGPHAANRGSERLHRLIRSAFVSVIELMAVILAASWIGSLHLAPVRGGIHRAGPSSRRSVPPSPSCVWLVFTRERYKHEQHVAIAHERELELRAATAQPEDRTARMDRVDPARPAPVRDIRTNFEREFDQRSEWDQPV